MKIHFLILITIVLTACDRQNKQEANASLKSRPNVILIVADDHGKDAIGCYGNPVIKTPNLDLLAASGTRFDRAFCTTASCSASRSVILTGLQNHANGHYGHQHAYHHFSSFDDVKSLPVLLAEGGNYRTAHVGKYHLAPESVYHFDHRFEADARSPIEMAEACESFIKSPSQQPYFLYFCFSDPHRSGQWAEELPHQPNRFGNRPEGYPDIEEVKYHPEEVLVPPFLPETPQTRSEIAQYYQSISRLDHGVGKLMEYLKSSGQFDNTLIIYISDNGMAFPGAKTTLYEAGIQLPCIAKFPGQVEGRVTNTMISWVDLVPSILDVAHVAYVDSVFHGQSFVPVLNGAREGRTEIQASHTFHEITMYYPMRVIRGEKYKLIMNLAAGLPYPFASDLYASKTWQSVLTNNLATLGNKSIEEFIHRPKFELYDLEVDPWETRNLALLPEYAPQLEKMVASLKSFQERTKDPWISKWEYE